MYPDTATGSDGMEREESFVAAVREHRHRLFRIAYGILRSSADAEDAVSDATEAAGKTLSRLRDPESLPVYLIRCTVNASRNSSSSSFCLSLFVILNTPFLSVSSIHSTSPVPSLGIKPTLRLVTPSAGSLHLSAKK